MYKKAIMTGSIVGWAATLIAFISTGLIYTNLQYKEDIKEELLAELESTGGNTSFENTEWNNGEEIIVDDAFIEIMPEVKEEVTSDEIEQINTPEEIPKEMNLEVTFFPQAPDADWSLPWKEACEESSIVQAYYYKAWKNLNKETFKKEVLAIVELEKKILGKFIDTSIEETAEILEQYFWYTDYKILENPSVEDLKYEIANGNPIVAPFAGKELGNSFFANGGPRYHMLVIVGYNDEYFLTNDVGTSRGENFAYSYDVIMNALHDLVPKWEDIQLWDKKVLVLQ